MELEDFMNMIADTPVQQSDSEYDKLMEEFKEKFGEGIPTEMLPPSITKDDIKAAMKTCLESGDGDILKVLGVEITDEYIY
ncbi:MAG: hypothetical protein K5871_08900 [Lachnospiraceae bacterium]|nr:hypothetical protein [Lachnospiraceae bacterium]